MAEFFLGCALGLEKQLLRELNELRPLLINESARFVTDTWKLTLIKGGVSVETSLIAGLQLNYWSKIANRVLLRVDQFRSQSVPRLHARLKECEIKRFLGSQKFAVQVEATKCKVSNEKTVRRLCDEIWDVDQDSDLQVFVRGLEDEWTVSLDTSGEHLHKRGYRQKIAAAPLRETLAAMTVRGLIKDQPLHGINSTYLMDPMAGSGTFLREAFELQRPTTTRRFTFERFGNCPKLLKSPQFWGNFKNHPMMPNRSLFRGYVAIDIDAKLQSVLEENLKPLEPKIVIDNFEKQTRQTLGVPPDAPLWAVVNPPYGERLQSLEWTDQFWNWLGKVKVDRLAIWLPDKQISFVADREPEEFLRLSNGGIPCTVLFFDLGKYR